MAAPQPQTIWAIGDLHGDALCAQHWVGRTGLVANLAQPPSAWVWTDAAAHLVLMGDYIDKGPRSKQTLKLVRALTRRFPSQVTALMGNHELNLLVDRAREGGKGHRYLEHVWASAHPAEYLNWLPYSARTENSSWAADRLYETLQTLYTNGEYAHVLMAPHGPRSIIRHVRGDRQTKALVSAELDRWQQAYLSSFGSATSLGQWLEQRPIAAIVADTLFVHGGVWPGLTRRELSALASGLSANAGERLLDGFLAAAPLAQELVEDRMLHKSCARVAEAASSLDVTMIAVGHTPADRVRISCDGTLLALDSSLGRWFRSAGNFYCPSSGSAAGADPSAFRCPRLPQECEGQIVRLSRKGRAQGGWHVEIVESEWAAARQRSVAAVLEEGEEGEEAGAMETRRDQAETTHAELRRR